MAERRSGAAEGLARLSEWADAHLSLLRNLSTGMAVAGVLVLARSVRMTAKFTSALDIPVAFVEKNVKLRGKLHQITERGLEVEHIPISIPFITSIQRKWQSKGLLLVRLAGVELAPSGLAWLQQELKPKQGRFLSVCLNEEILRQGLGRTARIEGLHHDSRLYWKLHKRLLRAELKALKKNKGIWKEESCSERIRDRISNNKFVQTLKQFASWLRSSI
ncbi:protein C3orf33 homolog isoform X1 [Gymnogyps californianus]|uniref:protein C3orf33 homolog isoform X1 n=1 Tax=Gymnogyps californianus TaxID=33616 RepID=UPI0021C70402|nr:protein C3orf33 homolog isoform X1 [Gymnogyps californianus]